MAQEGDVVFATLVMTDSYLPGAMVLGHSLRDRGAKAKLIACVLIEKLSQDTVTELQSVYDEIVPVQQIVNMQPANLYLMNRPDLISTFTKIELWKQTQYKRIVYLDADMVVLRAPNELLTMDTKFAAVPDVGWPDCFNSGLMVLNPNLADYYSLLALAHRGISFDGADQGLLNMHFTEWDRLSFTYNCTPNANYQYVPAYKYFQNSIKIIHFIGSQKPWTQGRDYRANSGVYSELLGRWWAVYDAHYRRPQPVPENQFVQQQKKVQDYVRGEETRYEPAPEPRPRRPSNSGYSITQPRPQPAPGIHFAAQSADSGAQERPFGDQPSLEERIQHEGYQPTPTVEQRRWSAPHAEWEPARQPPPPNSRPEAANFPTQQYEMSESRQLFEPPAKYPEPPKDMWYEVPRDKPQPAAAPKMIFPWEERAPKATRVFPKSREPTPPPVEEEEEEIPVDSFPQDSSTSQPTSQEFSGVHTELTASDGASKVEASTQRSSQPSAPPKPPSPPRHVFPWESRAPRATRVFPQEKPPSPPPNTARATADRDQPPPAAAVEEALNRTIAAASRSPDNPWDAFAQQTNKWDEDPEIARFMESFNRPRRAQVHVLHDNRAQPSDDGQGPPPARERRTSLKLTDFPTEVERPSLPVTPAPIRRPTVWGSDDQEEQSVLPLAKGVPRQEEWVRRFTSQYLPDFPDPVLRDIRGVLHLTCQHCGRQNPVIKLEELQRKQSLLLSGEDRLEGTKTPPRRQMPESNTQEEVIEAAMRGINIGSRPKVATKPHSILKEPSFEVTGADESELGKDSIVFSSHMTATGSKSPTRFNPIVLEGEAASESNTFFTSNDDPVSLKDESTTAVHHSTLPRSNSSHSAEDNNTPFNAAVTLPVVEEVVSPTTVA